MYAVYYGEDVLNRPVPLRKESIDERRLPVKGKGAALWRSRI